MATPLVRDDSGKDDVQNLLLLGLRTGQRSHTMRSRPHRQTDSPRHTADPLGDQITSGIHATMTSHTEQAGVLARKGQIGLCNSTNPKPGSHNTAGRADTRTGAIALGMTVVGMASLGTMMLGVDGAVGGGATPVVVIVGVGGGGEVGMASLDAVMVRSRGAVGVRVVCAIGMIGMRVLVVGGAVDAVEAWGGATAVVVGVSGAIAVALPGAVMLMAGGAVAVGAIVMRVLGVGGAVDAVGVGATEVVVGVGIVSGVGMRLLVLGMADLCMCLCVLMLAARIAAERRDRRVQLLREHGQRPALHRVEEFLDGGEVPVDRGCRDAHVSGGGAEGHHGRPAAARQVEGGLGERGAGVAVVVGGSVVRHHRMWSRQSDGASRRR